MPPLSKPETSLEIQSAGLDGDGAQKGLVRGHAAGKHQALPPPLLPAPLR